MLQKKDPFPKSMNDACRILAGLKNEYGKRDKKITDANDCMEFMTMCEESKTIGCTDWVLCWDWSRSLCPKTQV